MAPLQWLFFEGLRYSSAPTITSIDNVQQRVKHHFAEWGDNRTLCPLKQGLKHSGHALLSDPPELRGHPVPHSALILFKFLREPRSKNYCNHNRTHAPAVITCLLCRTLACFVKVPRGLSARNLFESAVEVHISKVSTAADTADRHRVCVKVASDEIGACSTRARANSYFQSVQLYKGARYAISVLA